MDGKPSVLSGLATLVGKPEKVERLRLSFAAFHTMIDRKTIELDQTQLALVKCQTKRRQPRASSFLAAIPNGRWQPSGLVIHTLREGNSRQAPR